MFFHRQKREQYVKLFAVMDCLCCRRLFILSATILCFTSLNCQARRLIACPKRNMYIKVLPNGDEKCKTCPPCEMGTQKKRCSLWRGTECEPCPLGYFNDKYGNKCNPCTICKPGQYVMESCSPTKDTVCAPCLRGTYSPVEGTARCFPCTPCKRHEELLRYCLPTRNTDCGDCMEGYFRESATESCWPCAKCHNDTFVVTECYQKSGGFSSKVCMPTNGMRSTKILEESLENEMLENAADDRDMESFTMVLTVVLVMAFFSASLISAVYLFILSSGRTRRFLGESRAVGKHDREKKMRIDSNYHDGEKKNKMYRTLNKSWKSLLRFFNHNKRYNSKWNVSSQNRSIRDSENTNSRLVISCRSTILDTGDIIDDEKLSIKQETNKVTQSTTFQSAKDICTLTLTDTDEKLRTSECCFTELDKRCDQSKALGNNSSADVRYDVDCNEMSTAYSTLYVDENDLSGSLTESVCTEQSVESVALRPKKKPPRKKQRLIYKNSTSCIPSEPKYSYVALCHTI